MKDSGMALADVIAQVHAHPWSMVPVPDAKWRWFTALPSTGAIVMWTRSDLLDDEEGGTTWCRLVGANGDGENYAVVLVCECGAREAYEVTTEMAVDSEDGCVMMQVTELDALMEPFVREHNPHRWQGRLW